MQLFPCSPKRRCCIVVGAVLIIVLSLVYGVYFSPGAVRQRRLREELVSVSKKGLNWQRQEQLTSIYRRYRPAEIARAMLQLMAASDPAVRQYAVSVPGGLDDRGLPWDWPAVRQQVHVLLKDHNPRVRSAAAVTVWHNWSPSGNAWDGFRHPLREMATSDPAPICRALAGSLLAQMGELSGLRIIIDHIRRVKSPGEVKECVVWLEEAIDSDARLEIEYGEFGSLIRWGSDPRLLKHAPEIARLWRDWYQDHKNQLRYDAEQFRWTLDRSQNARATGGQ